VDAVLSCEVSGGLLEIGEAMEKVGSSSESILRCTSKSHVLIVVYRRDLWLRNPMR
jgi:hypothetical protein